MIESKEKICVVCNKTFRTRQNMRKCCSDECSLKNFRLTKSKTEKKKRLEYKKTLRKLHGDKK